MSTQRVLTARVAGVLALALATAIAALELRLGVATLPVTILVVAPLAAAGLATARWTAIVAAYCVVLALGLGAWEGLFGDRSYVGGLIGLGAGSAIAIALGIIAEHLKRERWTATDRLAAEQSARREAEAAHERTRFLANATSILDATLDYRETLDTLGRLIVPRFADWCVVAVADDHGRIEDLAAAHADPEKAPLVEEMRRRFPHRLERETSVIRVMQSGGPELHREASEELVAEIATDDEHLEILQALGMESLLVVPLSARGRTFGAVKLVASGSRPPFDDRDLAFVTDLAARAAIIVDNARLYEQRTQMAQTLQRSLLPPSLPQLGDFELAARYRAAGEGHEVGGDFYEVFRFENDDWGIVAGDVCGKGAEAASLTGLVRHTLGAVAARSRGPSEALARLDEMLRRHRSTGDFVTIAAARLRPNEDSARCALAIGGHPAPLLLDSSGNGRPIGNGGPALNIGAGEGEWPEEWLQLQPGDSIVFYTDGVLEADRSSPLEPTELASEIEPHLNSSDAEGIALAFEELALERAADSLPDDLAVVVARYSPAGGAD